MYMWLWCDRGARSLSCVATAAPLDTGLGGGGGRYKIIYYDVRLYNITLYHIT